LAARTARVLPLPIVSNSYRACSSMPNPRVLELLERNKNVGPTLHMSPPKLVDVRKKLRGSGSPGGVVILSCSDPRVVPEKYFDLKKGDAAIVRNAGGRASDAVRSILTLDAIAGLQAILVVHHTDCGTTLVRDAEVREMMKKRAPERSEEIDKMTFGEIPDVDASVREDVALLKASPFLSKDTEILGYNLDVETGLLTEVK